MADLPIAEELSPAVTEAEPEGEEKPKTRRRPRARKKVEEASETEVAPAAQAVEVAAAVLETLEAEPAADEKPKRKTRAKKKPDDAPVEAKPTAKGPITPEPSNEDAPGELRRGWWQRTFG